MKKPILQTPFRETKLLSETWFKSYCSENGADLYSDDLERLHKEGLLYPAVKVYRGVCEMKKIYAKFNGSTVEEWRYVNPEDVEKFNPKKIIKRSYYTAGGFYMTHGWLEYYKTNGMIEYPAERKFAPWDQTLYKDFQQNRKLLEKQHELLYDPLQLIPLKVILREATFWRILDKDRIEKEKQTLKKYLVEINHFLAFYINAEKIVLKETNKRNEYIKKCAHEGYVRRDIVKMLQQEDAFIIGLFKKKAKQLLNEHEADIEYIERWQNIIARFSVIGEIKRAQKYRHTYLKMMNEEALIKAEDVNQMIYILNRFVFFVSGKQKTIKQVLEYSDFPRCTACENYFSPKKIGQKTCGREECIREHKNALKRKRRA